VLFDLDDTLFDQATWLSGAWDAVAAAARPQQIEYRAMRTALSEISSEGSGGGRIIDRALERVGRSDIAVAPLLARFRAHAPERLALYHGVADALQAIRQRVAIGLVSDGDPTIQRNKLRALGLESRFDIVVLSDELGREHRKPSPVPLLAALTALGVDARDAIFVGDRPEKDIAAASAAGMRGIRVRTGEYARRPDVPQPWATAPDVVTAIKGILALAPAPRSVARVVAAKPVGQDGASADRRDRRRRRGPAASAGS
jgi:haloacid dehalogenase superfamily, subfamily IA, variant 3 with third motif having DD or ED/haloacid dehalogenase superfamily, subfamily IA, variant 1 with third motif having Dx(3-4)D or Dx(3-4)E